MLYMALDMGISAEDFWELFTPRGILLLVKQRAKLNRKTQKAKPEKRTQAAPPPRIARVPR